MSVVPCQVCNGVNAQYHFGAVVCRACAAFFRRYVNSRKSTIACNCFAKRESQYPCRLCRMKKCLAIGMQKSKVQGPRDQNSPTAKKRAMVMSSPGASSSPDSFSSIPSIEIGIKLRNMDRIEKTSKNYGRLETTRKAIFNGGGKGTDGINLYDLSMEVKTDAKLLWKFCEESFAEFGEMSRNDKKILFFNFHTKWSVIEMVMSAIKYNDAWKCYGPSGAPSSPIEKFYENRCGDRNKLTEEDALRIFKPFWTFHTQNIIQPLAKMMFSREEYMALFGILLWDAGYSNVSDSLGETCRAMRNIICRELKVHFEENGSSESKFFETLGALSLVERAEKKCQEEIQMCEMYDVEMDEDMRNLITWEKY